MLLYISLAFLSYVVMSSIQRYQALQRNIDFAKKSGIPYIVTPFYHIGGIWIGAEAFVIPLLLKTPIISRYSSNIKALSSYANWYWLRDLQNEVGDVFLVVSPYAFYFNSSNAEVNAQVTSRKTDFLKPVDVYTIVNIFGVSMLSSEGEDWKRHRKIVAPAFSEKSNALVWQESVKQAQSMLKYWESQEGNSSTQLNVGDVAPDVSTLALHIICGAGFGVPQTWPGESEGSLGTRVVPGFNTEKLLENHRLTFKHTLHFLGEFFVWIAVLPMWLLKRLPFEVHKNLWQAYQELAVYLNELVDYKRKKLEAGEKEVGIMDLLAPLIEASERAASITDSSDDSAIKAAGALTQSEITGNAFIFMFAGHETSANVLHFSILHLAMHPSSQRRLQSDVSSIVSTTPPSQWTYQTEMGQLYNSHVGAVMNETLRLVPPIISIPKVTGPSPVTISMDNKTLRVPQQTFMHINVVGSARNPRYYPSSRSKTTDKSDDLDDFVPARWLERDATAAQGRDIIIDDGLGDAASFEAHSTLFHPPRGAFLPFSDGVRACPGRRFAQVEITAILAVVFGGWSVELDVRQWASDEEVARMRADERRAVYEKAREDAMRTVRRSMSIVTLKLRAGERVPVRWVRRGEEWFAGC